MLSSVNTNCTSLVEVATTGLEFSGQGISNYFKMKREYILYFDSSQMVGKWSRVSLSKRQITTILKDLQEYSFSSDAFAYVDL